MRRFRYPVDTDQFADIRMMLREFYQVLKDEGAYLKFVFITGVTRFSQMSIFTELNFVLLRGNNLKLEKE